jgi:hypothetical protein
LCFADHVALAAIAQTTFCTFERDPQRLLDFNAHLPGYVVNFSAFISQQEEAHNLEHPLFVAPRTHIYILDIGEFGDDHGPDAGLFKYLAHRGLCGIFPGIDNALGKSQNLALITRFALGRVRGASLSSGLNYGNLPAHFGLSYHHSPG